MQDHEGDARRERRQWLLRVFSQSQQRQQVGRGGVCVQRIQTPGTWQPGQGWVGQNSPEAAWGQDDVE